VKTKAFAIVTVTCAILFTPIRAWAIPVEVFTLEGVSYSSPNFASGTLSGTFDYNGTFSNISITATGGIVNGDVFNTDSGSTSTLLVAEASDYDALTLAFATALPSSGGGSVGVTGDTVSSKGLFIFSDGNIALSSEFIADSGSVSTETPLPAGLPLFATGLGAMGVLGWRKKRKASAMTAA
jgi:hypothetical protein